MYNIELKSLNVFMGVAGIFYVSLALFSRFHTAVKRELLAISGDLLLV